METITTRDKTLRMTLTGMFMAMNVILSMSIFSVPVPGGHLYFCDTVINTAAILLDPTSAFITISSFFISSSISFFFSSVISSSTPRRCSSHW